MKALALSLFLLPACVSASVGARVGPTITSQGDADVQATLTLGLGYGRSNTSGVQAGMGVSSGTRNALELASEIEFVELEHEIGYRAGVVTQVPLVGQTAPVSFLQGGILHALHSKKNSGGHEKSFSTRSGSYLCVGAVGRVGVSYGPEHETAMVMGMDLSADYFLFSHWD